jgi:hypothetical protein
MQLQICTRNDEMARGEWYPQRAHARTHAYARERERELVSRPELPHAPNGGNLHAASAHARASAREVRTTTARCAGPVRARTHCACISCSSPPRFPIPFQAASPPLSSPTRPHRPRTHPVRRPHARAARLVVIVAAAAAAVAKHSVPLQPVFGVVQRGRRQQRRLQRRARPGGASASAASAAIAAVVVVEQPAVDGEEDRVEPRVRALPPPCDLLAPDRRVPCRCTRKGREADRTAANPRTHRR